MRLIDADSLRDEFENDIELDSYFACKTIDKWPTIDAAPVVHARWIHPLPYPSGKGGDPYCSNCKMAAPWFPLNGYYEPDCCPHCGAKMDAMEDRI